MIKSFLFLFLIRKRDISEISLPCQDCKMLFRLGEQNFCFLMDCTDGRKDEKRSGRIISFINPPT